VFVKEGLGGACGKCGSDYEHQNGGGEVNKKAGEKQDKERGEKQDKERGE
jgi:hypothetical protein